MVFDCSLVLFYCVLGSSYPLFFLQAPGASSISRTYVTRRFEDGVPLAIGADATVSDVDGPDPSITCILSNAVSTAEGLEFLSFDTGTTGVAIDVFSGTDDVITYRLTNSSNVQEYEKVT